MPYVACSIFTACSTHEQYFNFHHYLTQCNRLIYLKFLQSSELTLAVQAWRRMGRTLVI